MRSINFYKTENGKEPVRKYLDSLQSKQAQRVAWVFELIEELERVPKQYFKKLKGTDDIWEIRAQYGNDIFRILSFFDGQNIIIAAHGFTKKTQKTPPKEIETAERRKTDHFRRKRK